MVKVDKMTEAEAAQVESFEKTEKLKLNPGEIIHNIVLERAKDAESKFGKFIALTFKSVEDGEKMHFVCPDNTVWGRKCAEVFTEKIEGVSVLNPKFKDLPIYVGMSPALKSKDDRTYYDLVWGEEVKTDGE